MKKYHLILLAILILAALLRFDWLNKVPPSLSWDEVSIGYNAWSILKTGKDEYGLPYPLLFRSFEDYKLPGMVYSVAVSEKIFGLNEWGVRFPSAFFGTLTVLFFYLFVKELFKKFKAKERYSLFASFIFAINPWHISFCRQCFEANASLFFVVTGVFFLLKSLETNYLLPVSAIFLSVSLYFYYSARVVVLAILLAFVLVFANFIRKNIAWVLGSLILGGIILLPLLPSFFTSGGFSRISQVNILNDSLFIGRMDSYTQLIDQHQNAWWARLIYNRRVALLETFFGNFLKNLSLEHIFNSGSLTVGLLYHWELPFFLLGLYFLVTIKEKWKWIAIAWLLSGTMAGALTTNQPNSLRALITAPVFVLITCLGLVFLWEKRVFVSRKACLIFSGVVLIFLVRFLVLYFDYLPKTYALTFGDGYKQLAETMEVEKDSYDTIWITGDYWRPYIQLLFHLEYDPGEYQKDGQPDGFDIFKFGRASWDKEGIFLREAKLTELVSGRTLFVLSNGDYRAQKARGTNFKKSQSINGLYAKDVFWLTEL